MIRTTLLAGCLLALGGCAPFELISGVQGSGKSVKETRSAPGFKAIVSEVAANVEVRIGSTAKVEITGDDNLVPLIKTHVEKGVLEISSEKSLRPKAKTLIVITTPQLESFTLDGAGNVKLIGMNTPRLAIELNGAGNIDGSGLAKELDLQLDGAGNLNLFELRGDRVSIDLNGAGNAEVHAISKLSATLSGAGNIRYRGAVKDISTTKNGVGNIKAG